MAKKFEQSQPDDLVSKLTPDAVIDLASQYQHRLLSLEAELRDNAMHMSKRLWRRRMRALNRLHEQLHGLRMACAPVARTTSHPKRTGQTQAFSGLDDLGLPLSTACTPMEVELCEKYIGENLKFTAHAENMAQRVLKWTRQTIAGKSHWFLTTWRLSRMRRMIEDVETRTRQVLSDCASLDAWIEQFVRSVAPETRGSARDLIDGLIAIFSKLEDGVSRVARLRSALRTEQGRLAQMEAWMARRGFDRAPAALRPPTPLSTLIARERSTAGQAHPSGAAQPKGEILGKGAQANAVRSLVPLPRDRVRLTLARRFIGALDQGAHKAKNSDATHTGAWQVSDLTPEGSAEDLTQEDSPSPPTGGSLGGA
jgi:hypothetical protein